MIIISQKNPTSQANEIHSYNVFSYLANNPKPYTIHIVNLNFWVAGDQLDGSRHYSKDST